METSEGRLVSWNGLPDNEYPNVAFVYNKLVLYNLSQKKKKKYRNLHCR